MTEQTAAMIDLIRRAIFEHPITIACGPAIASLAAGYAVMVWGEFRITVAGMRYLEQVETRER